MGGKHKQAQRTKNNVRPSSSGRSAELLGNRAPAYVGFTATKDGGFSPVLPGFTVATAEEVDSNVDPNFQLLLKKMNKKDSTTKLKALQEFAELVRNSDPDAVKAVLPFWPRIYCHLAVDVEHRVREAAHQAQRAVVLRAKRNLAPYLRQLAGPWFTSQYDTYPPAASAAAQAYQDAFSSTKATEALVFCQAEILSYIHDNLILHTAQSLSNPNVATAEEMEAKYQRVVVSSLQGYALFLRSLPEQQLQSLHETNKKIISSKKFWKYPKHSSSLIRNAWFTALIALCQKTPQLLETEVVHVTLAVFSNLDETDPTVLPTVWEASLHVLTAVQDCWQHVNAEKLVLPKLLRILREGGLGNATTIFPNLLPLLSKMPPSICSDSQTFCGCFFENMRNGMCQKSVMQSASESAAVTKCYVECLRYITMLNIRDSDFCEDMVQNQLVPAVRLMFKEQKLHTVAGTLFPQVSELVHHWSQSETHAYLLQTFWNALSSCLKSLLTHPELEDSLKASSANPLWILDRQVQLCLNLKDPKGARANQSLRVKFRTEETCPVIELPENVHIPASLDIELSQHLNRLVNDLITLYLKEILCFQEKSLIALLEKLMVSFESKELFEHILRTMDDDINTNGALIELFSNIFVKWLLDEDICSEAVVNIIFVLFKFLADDEKRQVLMFLSQVQNGSVLLWCVKAGLANYTDPTVSRWLNSDGFCKILKSLVKNMSTNSNSETAAKDILKKCLKATINDEMVINTELLSEVLWELSTILSSAQVTPACIDFVTDLLLELFVGENLNVFLGTSSALEEIIISAFRVNCQKEDKKLTKAWQTAFTVLAQYHGSESEMFMNISCKIANVIKDALFVKDGQAVEHLVSVVVLFLQCMNNSSDWSPSVCVVLKLALVFFKNIAAETDDLMQFFTVVCLSGLYINSTVSVQDDVLGHLHMNITQVKGIEDTIGDYEEKLAQCTKLIIFITDVISKLPECWDRGEGQSTGWEGVSFVSLKVNSIICIEEHIMDTLYFLTLCSIFGALYKTQVYWHKISRKHSVLKKRLKELLNCLDVHCLEHLVKLATKRSKENGYLWVLAVYMLYTELLQQPQNLLDVYADLRTQDSKARTLAPQVFTSCVKTAEFQASELQREKMLTLKCWIQKLQDFLNNDDDDEAKCTIQSSLDLVINWYTQEDHKELLFYCPVTWPQVLDASAIAHFLAATITKCPQILNGSHWDAVMICTASWMHSVKDSQHTLLSSAHKDTSDFLLLAGHSEAMFAIAVFNLYRALLGFFAQSDYEDEVLKSSHDKLSQEWVDIFAAKVSKALLSAFQTFADAVVQKSPLLLMDIPVAESLSQALQFVDLSFLESYDVILQQCLKLMHSTVPSVQLIGQQVLHRLVPGLVQDDLAALGSETVAPETESTGLSLAKFDSIFQEISTIIDTVLLDVRVGQSCTVCPFTDVYAYTTGYFLIWSAVLEMCRLATPELRFKYATMLRNSGHLSSLLYNVFRLMPEAVLKTSDPKVKAIKISQLFPTNLENTNSLEHLACWVYYNTLQRLPAMVRQWWNDTESRVTSLVERVTAIYFAPLLCAEEMKAVQDKSTQKGNMQVKVHPSTREIVAIYKVDDARMEISIVLPYNYPLGSVKVESGRQLVESAQWRNWMMQLTVFLTHQNGYILDGLTLWKSNLDKRFEGVEECYICFSILHGSSFQIPRLCCSTCRKKFHSACLYKWFNTSNNATCPICRNLF